MIPWRPLRPDVANSRYTDSRLARLEAPTHDAEALAAVLAEPGIGSFEVATVVDEEAPRVMQRIEEFCDGRARDDLLLLAFSDTGSWTSRRGSTSPPRTRASTARARPPSPQFVHDVMEGALAQPGARPRLLQQRGVRPGRQGGRGDPYGQPLRGARPDRDPASDALQFAFEGERIEGEPVRSVFTGVLVEG